MKNLQPITEELVIKVRDTVSCGLSKGLGEQIPGYMCVEAAVCYAYGLPHDDNPPCVGKAVRSFKVRLNDANWSSNEARAKGMLALSIAQLNSIEIDQEEFARKIVLKTMNTIIANLAAKYLPEQEQALKEVTNIQVGKELCLLVRKAAAADAAAAAAASAAADAADAAYAAAASADAAADAAYAAADAASPKNQDTMLILAAQNCLEVLQEMKSPGCEFLYLIEQKS